MTTTVVAGVLMEHVGQQVCDTADKFCLLLRSDISFFCDFDVDVGHGGPPCFTIQGIFFIVTKGREKGKSEADGGWDLSDLQL
jgi:hypothetical protein